MISEGIKISGINLSVRDLFTFYRKLTPGIADAILEYRHLMKL